MGALSGVAFKPLPSFKKVSLFFCVKLEISFLKLVVRALEKNLARKAFLQSSHKLMEFEGRVFSQWCVLSPKEKGNSLSLML